MKDFELALQLLTDEGLIDWPCLLVGLERFWVTKADVASYALACLTANPDVSDDILQLAVADDLTDRDVFNRLSHLTHQVCGEVELATTQALTKWRYALLKLLVENPTDPEEKMNQLQRIYALFDYPADMAGCSRYGPSEFAIRHGYVSENDYSLPPFEVLNQLVVQLRNLLR